MIGSSGSYASSKLIQESDHIISVGCDINKILPKSTFLKKNMTIVDIDQTQLDPKNKMNLNINSSSINFLQYIVKEIDSYKSQWSKDFLQKMREMNIKAQKEEISKNNKAFIY